jgi:hypothetical protein
MEFEVGQYAEALKDWAEIARDLKGRVKTGHAGSPQNRPYEMAEDVILIYPAFS